MNWFRSVGWWVVVLVWLASGVGCTNAADDSEKPSKGDPVVIPLGQIWAWQMPGTRDVRELEKTSKSAGQLISNFRKTLSYQAKKKMAKPAFVVEGIGFEALREAHSIVTGRRKPTTHFSPKEELSIVFFSHEYGYYIHIHEVVKSHNTITVSYRPVPHRTKEMTRHFALIPIGKNAFGKFKVKIVRLPMEQRFVDAGFKEGTTKWESRIVCTSFGFEILETKSE